MAPSPLLPSSAISAWQSDFKLAQCHAPSHIPAYGNRVLPSSTSNGKTEWPRIVQTFKQYVVPKYEDSLNQETPFPKKTGLLSHVAIAENNMVVLEVLLKLRKSPHFRRMPKMNFSQVLRCAAYCGRLQMLKWLQHELSKDSEWTWEIGLLASALKSPHPDLDLLEWLCDHCPLESAILCTADIDTPARLGNLDAIRFLHQRGYTIPVSAMDSAATHGRIKLVKFLHHYGTEGCSTNAMDGAASNGYLGIVRFLHDYRSEGCTVTAMNRAAENGFLGVVRFLHIHRSEGCTTAAMDGAASNGHIAVVRFLHRHRTEGCSSRAMDKAAAKGDIEMVRFLHKCRKEGCTVEAMNQSAAWDRYASVMSCYRDSLGNGVRSRRAVYYSWDGDGGDMFLGELHAEVGTTDATNLELRKKHLEVIQFLHENRSEGCTSEAMDEAARIGHLEVVEFLHEHRSEGCTTDAMDNAAWRGHLEIVKFLHENRTEGCTTDAIAYAAREGHLEVVKFLFANRIEGCTTTAMDGAAADGRLDVVKYFHKHRFEGCTTDAMDLAAKNGHLEIVQFLDNHRDEGCTTIAMDDAAAAGHLDIVRYLHENRTEGCTTKAMDTAAKNGHLAVVTFLHETRTEGCTKTAIDEACGEGEHLDVVQYLHENRNEGCTSRALEIAISAGNTEAVKFLYENRAEIHVFPSVTRATLHSHPEFVRYACQTVPDAIPESLLNHSALSEDQSLLGVLCAYSTKGCLLEAKRLAQQNACRDAVAVLDSYISKGIETCSLAQHSADGPRRCQRVPLCSSPASSWNSYCFDTVEDPILPQTASELHHWLWATD
ncbi:hypothetical protein Gpo141_00000029 [Globisporangium polare]